MNGIESSGRMEAHQGPGHPGRRRVSAFAGVMMLATVLLVFVVGRARAEEPEAAPLPLATTHDQAEIEAAERAGEEALAVPDSQTIEDPNLNRTEALELMEGNFGNYLEGASGIFDGLSVKRFLNATTAIVGREEQEEIGYEGAARGSALLESSVPLETDSAVPGVLQPVDLTLERSEGEIQAANPLVEVGIPSELKDGIQLNGVEIRLADAAGDRSAALSETDAAFYPEALEDTDLAIAPTPSGVETLTQLRSPEAPTEETYEFRLPVGASLSETPEGGAKAVQGGKELIYVLPPTAVDANGEPVKADLTVDGATVTIKVDPKPEAAYPIMVDPVLGYDTYPWEPGGENWTGWSGYRTPTSVGPNTYNEPSYGCTTYCYLYTSANAGGWIWEQTQTVWTYQVPRFQTDFATFHKYPTSYIGCIVTGSNVFTGNGDYTASPKAIDAISNEAGGWLSTFMWPPNISGTITNCTTGNSGKLAGFGMFADGISQLSQPRYFLAGYAQIVLKDEDLPVIAASGNPPHWANASVKTFPLTVTDTGLGVGTIRVTKSNGEVLGVTGAKAPSGSPCTGTTRAACPREWKGEQVGNEVAINTASLPQGTNVLNVTAQDPVGNVSSAQTVEVKVDHTAPELALSGSLLEQKTIGTTLPQYTVTVEAHDGTTASPQSGVSDAEIKVDGIKKNTESGWAPGCGSQNCSLVKTWTLKASEYSVGKHTLEVVAHDALGIASTPKIVSFEIATDKTAPQVVGSGALVEGPKGWIMQGQSTSFHGEIKDPGGSGATYIELKVTGATSASKSEACIVGACILSKNFVVATSSLSGGTHTVTLIGKDGAGNVSQKSWTFYVNPIGSVSAAETEAVLEDMEKTSGAAPIAPVSELASAEEIAEGNNPSLVETPESLTSEGVPVESSLASEGPAVIELETEEGTPITFEPIASTGGTPPEVTEEVAAISANTGQSVDTVTRPIYNGVMQFEVIRSPTAPEEYGYAVEMWGGETLKQLNPNQVGVFHESGTEAALITAEEAWDTAGNRIETTLSVTGPDEITLRVHHRAAGVVYPVVAGPKLQAGYGILVTSPKYEPKPEEQLNEESIAGVPSIKVRVSPPEPGATGSGLLGYGAYPPYLQEWGAEICAPFGICEAWENRFRGFFYYNLLEAWYTREPKCIPSAGVSYSLSIQNCEWVGGNHQPYGAGYHITALTIFIATKEFIVVSKSYTKAAVMRAYGDGNFFFHATDKICNPSRPGC